MGGRRGILKFIGNLLNIFMSVWIVLLYFDFFFQNSEIAEFCSVLFSCIEEKNNAYYNKSTYISYHWTGRCHGIVVMKHHFDT